MIDTRGVGGTTVDVTMVEVTDAGAVQEAQT